MNAPGKTMHDRLAQYARQLPNESVLSFNDIQCECTMHTAQVLMDYGPRSEKHVPYLHLIGEVSRVSFPQEVTPYLHGVDSLTFPKGAGLQTDVFYKFNRQELTDMVQKGYFDDKFGMPDIFYDNDFELPMSCNLLMVQPDKEGEPPIMFVGLNNPRSMEFTAESSGYELGSYFEHVPELESVRETEVELEDAAEPLPDDVEFDNEFSDELLGAEVDEPVAEEQAFEDEMDAVADEPEESEEEAAIRRLMEHYNRVEARVGTYVNRTRADIERDIQVASGVEVNAPVVEDAVVDVTDAKVAQSVLVAVDEPVVETVQPEPVAGETEIEDAPSEAPVATQPEESITDEVVSDAVIDAEADDAIVSEEPVESETTETMFVDAEKSGDDEKISAGAKRAAVAAHNQHANQERKPIPASLEDVADAAGVEYADDDDFADSI